MNLRSLAHRRSWIVVEVVASLVASHAAFAASDQRTAGVAPLARYKQECAACHVAFPPGMPAAQACTPRSSAKCSRRWTTPTHTNHRQPRSETAPNAHDGAEAQRDKRQAGKTADTAHAEPARR